MMSSNKKQMSIIDTFFEVFTRMTVLERLGIDYLHVIICST